MKKYCLTDCAKEKLDRTKDNLAVALAMVTSIILITMSVAAILIVIGVVVNLLLSVGLFPEPDEPFNNIFESGIAGLMISMALGIVGTVLYKFFTVIYSGVKKVSISVVDYFSDDYESCQLFKECEEKRKKGKMNEKFKERI
jgi:accessory gene regulator protein AgrB